MGFVEVLPVTRTIFLSGEPKVASQQAREAWPLKPSDQEQRNI